MKTTLLQLFRKRARRAISVEIRNGKYIIRNYRTHTIAIRRHDYRVFGFRWENDWFCQYPYTFNKEQAELVYHEAIREEMEYQLQKAKDRRLQKDVYKNIRRLSYDTRTICIA